MIKIFDKDFDINKVLNREIQTYGEYESVVKEVIANVLCNGDKALKEYTQKFDGVLLENLLVSQDEIDEAKAQVSDEFKNILKTAAENISFFHQKQKKQGFFVGLP